MVTHALAKCRGITFGRGERLQAGQDLPRRRHQAHPDAGAADVDAEREVGLFYGHSYIRRRQRSGLNHDNEYANMILSMLAT